MNLTKTFRLFISSTFSDFKREREVLQTKVFPVIREYASSKGYTFQPIDLRWGVSNEAQLDQKTLELCLEEVRNCKSYPHPNFLVMLGDRYGWVPLPYAIEKNEFNKLKEKIEENNNTLNIVYEKYKVYDDLNNKEKFHYEKKEPRITTSLELLKQWYTLDKNQIPQSYILNERDRESDYAIYENWVAEENKLRKILQDAVDNSDITKDESKKSKYFTSATEAEIIEGIVSYKNETKNQKSFTKEVKKIDSKYVFGFLRNITSEDDLSSIFVDSDTDKVKKLKDSVKAIIADNIADNILDKNIKQINKDTLDESYLKIVVPKEGKEFLNKYLERVKENYGETFEYRVIEFLKKQIDEQKNKEEELNQSNLEIEKEAQKYFAKQKRNNFYETNSLRELLDKINEYIGSENSSQPLIIYGTSGSGKSSLMSKAIQDTCEKYNSCRDDLNNETKEVKKVIYRFVGATPYSSSTKEILTSVFEELGKNIRNDSEKNSVFNDSLILNIQGNQETFEEFSYRIHDEVCNLDEEVIIFIDAVDQLNNDEQFLWLPNNLPANVKIIISALDDKDYKDSHYFKTLENKKIGNRYSIPEFDKQVELLEILLKEEGRIIQDDQKVYFSNMYLSNVKQDNEDQLNPNTPLYITIAAQEMRHWKSYDYVEDNPLRKIGGKQSLHSTQQGIIEEFIINLSKVYHHNENFVKRVLGYIYASRDGLSESELIQLISTDKAFIEDMAPEKYHKNYTGELPMVHWSRLYAQLKPFLSVKTQDGEELMYFFHREFTKVLSEQENQEDQHKNITKALKIYIARNQNKPFYESRWGKIFIYLVETGRESSMMLDFISSNIDNKIWVADFFNYMNDTTLKYNKENKESKAMMYASHVFTLATLLYIKDNSFWYNAFVIAHVNWGLLYATNKDIKESIKLLSRALSLMDNFPEQNKPANFNELYRTIFIQCAILSVENNQPDIGIEMLESIVDTFEKGVKGSEALEYYANALIHLGRAYNDKEEYKKAFYLQEKSLLLYKKLYKSSKSVTIKTDYIFALREISKTSRNLNDKIKVSIKYLEEALTLSEEFYHQNKNLEHVHYIESLIDLGKVYVENSIFDKSQKMYQKALTLCEEYFQNNPYKHARNYVDILLLSPVSYKEEIDIQLYIKNLLKSEYIIEKYYNIKYISDDKEYQGIIVQLVLYFYHEGKDVKLVEYYKKIALQKNIDIPLNDEFKVLFFNKLSNVFKNFNDIENETLVLEQHRQYIGSLSNHAKYKVFYDDVLYRLIENYQELNKWEEVIDLENELSKRWFPDV